MDVLHFGGEGQLHLVLTLGEQFHVLLLLVLIAQYGGLLHGGTLGVDGYAQFAVLQHHLLCLALAGGEEQCRAVGRQCGLLLGFVCFLFLGSELGFLLHLHDGILITGLRLQFGLAGAAPIAVAHKH